MIKGRPAAARLCDGPFEARRDGEPGSESFHLIAPRVGGVVRLYPVDVPVGEPLQHHGRHGQRPQRRIPCRTTHKTPHYSLALG